MDVDTEKLCLDEMDHVILDCNKKVTLAYISNNWNIHNKDGEVILEKWLKNYDGNKRIFKEYLIRGADSNGNSIITIVAEKKLPKVEKICPSYSKTLYSIEVGSNNGKSLNPKEPVTNKFIGLKLESKKRDIKVNQIVVPPKVNKVAEAPKKSTNPFGGFKPKAEPAKEVKTEKVSPTKDVKTKNEKISPKAQSPKKNQGNSKTSKVTQGKSSISSFFASKPSTSSAASAASAVKSEKLVSEATSKIEQVKIKDEIVEDAPVETKNKHKRSLSNVSDSNEEAKSISSQKKPEVPAKKKMKLEPKSARSRLMQICDSSSDEDDTSNTKDVPMDDEEEAVVKKEKENKTPSPDKSSANKTNGSTSSSGKSRPGKVKKTVTRAYEDEDGFINTVREVVEVSCSEEEPEVTEPPKKPAQSAPVIAPASNSSTAKKKISPPVGKKQGSILSFFSKK